MQIVSKNLQSAFSQKKLLPFWRASFLLAILFFDRGDLIDPTLMSAALKLGRKEELDDLQHESVSDALFTEGDHICIVVQARVLCAIRIVTMRTANPGHFVCRNGNADAGRAN